MKIKKHYYIVLLSLLSFAAALYDISAGIYLAVLANVVANIITVSRQRSTTTIKRVKKERPLTVDEFREREMEANPHRPYPYFDKTQDPKFRT
jgi:K+ transporter